MNKPLISIIIPVFNIAPYLSRCLESVINQTYKKLEIIIIDDGSSDESGLIADSYAEKDGRIFILHKKNEGVSAARNIGLEKAKGEYIGFVDGDDYVEPDMFELLINNAISYKADISHCGFKMVFPDRHYSYYGTGVELIQNRHESLRELLLGKIIEPGLCNKLYKKELFKSVRFRDDIRNLEDLLANYYLFGLAEKTVFCDKTKYHYMVRKNSASTCEINMNKILGPILAVLEIEDHAKNNAVIYPYALKKCIVTHINVYNNIVKNRSCMYKEEKAKINKTIISLGKKAKKYGVLTRKHTAMVLMISRLSFVYDIIYKVYYKFSKTKYFYKVD